MRGSRKTFFLLGLILVQISIFGLIIVNAEDGSPTLHLTINRIENIDTIEDPLEGEPEWMYIINFWDGANWLKIESDIIEGNGDVELNHILNLTSLTSTFTNIHITLLEKDTWTDLVEFADISGEPGTTQQTRGAPAGVPMFMMYKGVYNLATGDLTGDPISYEFGLFKTSGDYDGSTNSDENDAAVWFSIQDDYEPPLAEAGPDQFSYTEDEFIFDGSTSRASNGSKIIAYDWDFDNDGVFEISMKKPKRVFELMGIYTVTLRVTDSLGETNSDFLTVNVLNREPTALFNFTPFEPTVFETIQFHDYSSDPDGNVTLWNWDFGDGTTSDLENPTHQYEERGSYLITLTITDNDGGTNTVNKVISTSNLGPEAKFRAPSSVNVGESVIFIDESSDPERGILSYVWDFGDGATSTVKNPIHQYQTPDSVIVTLTVTDDMEVSSTTTRTIIIFPAIRPEADFSIVMEEGTINDIFEFYDESSDADGSILSWEWDFGDGDTSSRMNPTHNFNDKGTYRVTLTVTDNDGNMDTVTKSISITNLPPNATFSASMTTVKTNEEIKFIDDSIDPEGHRLIYSYDFGDGSTSDASNPTHSYEEEGSYTVTLTVTDDEGDSDIYSLNVKIEKDTPETNGGIPGFPVTSIVIGLIIGILLLSNIPRYYRREII